MDRDHETSLEKLWNRHLRFGWWCLFCYILLGLVLDAFHAFKVPWYLNVGNETRRLMGTLAHTHGTLLGGLNVAFAYTLRQRKDAMLGIGKIASPCLMSAAMLMPAGFLLAGLFTVQGEPGFGIFLVPVGGLLLVTAVGLTATAIMKDSSAGSTSANSTSSNSTSAKSKKSG